MRSLRATSSNLPRHLCSNSRKSCKKKTNTIFPWQQEYTQSSCIRLMGSNRTILSTKRSAICSHSIWKSNRNEIKLSILTFPSLSSPGSSFCSEMRNLNMTSAASVSLSMNSLKIMKMNWSKSQIKTLSVCPAHTFSINLVSMGSRVRRTGFDVLFVQPSMERWQGTNLRERWPGLQTNWCTVMGTPTWGQLSSITACTQVKEAT